MLCRVSAAFESRTVKVYLGTQQGLDLHTHINECCCCCTCSTRACWGSEQCRLYPFYFNCAPPPRPHAIRDITSHTCNKQRKLSRVQLCLLAFHSVPFEEIKTRFSIWAFYAAYCAVPFERFLFAQIHSIVFFLGAANTACIHLMCSSAT